jgi:SH3 domain/BAR domain
VDLKMIRPAQDAKDSLHLLKKTIKKREDKKLDFERYQSRYDAGMKKSKRTEREDAALMKAKDDLSQATDAYEAADENLRNCLPRLLTTVFSLLPHILAAQIQIQNTLLAHYYTQIASYCTEENFPNPSPPMDEVIRFWDDAFKPTQRSAEAIGMLASGKAVRQSMHLEPNGNGYSNGMRRPSNQSYSRGASVSPARALPPSPNYPKISPSPSPSTISLMSPAEAPVLSPSSTTSSAYATPGLQSFSPAGPTADYFSRDRHPSSTSISSSISAQIQGKKKPPPPPPRIPSQQHLFVTALYDFDGQGRGDLFFKEGDRIRVIKKTESTDDWWQGELKGVQGAFPANYCQ